MSVFNESERLLRESIDSILTQTYSDFELIIVCDNPSRGDEIQVILDSYNDSRIKYIVNEANMGLAMSLNTAFKIATADIIARMDADDIAEPNRFECQIKCFDSQQCDLVFSRYSYIDENSETLSNYNEQTFFQPQQLSNKIAVDPNIIHHPTVMFTRDIFEQTGDYRDFPCSQDADLWLRMQECGCRFLMLPDKLLRYRINTNSVSSKRWFQQQLTIHYIMKLSLERLQKGHDSFSKENYQKYLQAKGVSKESKVEALHRSENILYKAAKYKAENKMLKALALRLYVFATSGILRDYYLSVMRKKRLLRLK